MESAKNYWDTRSDLFGNYYMQPSLFDKIFRKGIYKRIARSITYCKNIPNATVLDIGSGPGINSVSLIQYGNASHVTGIDFSPKMIDYANKFAQQEGFSEKCEFILGDAIKYDFKDKKYDLTLALGVFDYTSDAQSLLKKMSELTINTFIVSWPKNGLRLWLRQKRYTCPVYHYTEEDIRKLHKNAGIEPDQLEIIVGRAGYSTIARK